MADDKMKQAPKKKVDTFTESLLPETDARLAKITGVGLIIAVCLAVWFSTIELIVDDVAFDDVASEDLEASMQIEEKKEEKKEKKKEEAKKPRKKAGGGGKPRGKGNPKAPQSRGVLKMITTRSQKSGYSAYQMTGKMSKDIDKVLKNVAGLQTSGKQVLGGRRGTSNGSFNEGYAEGGSGGIGDMLGGLMGGGGGAISTTARGKIRAPSAKDIEMGAGGGSRSASEIMKVVRSRTPGLRHVYNKALKEKPGFAGKVTLRFTIAPGGEIISISVASSTTGYSKFDNQIKSKVQRWKFKKIKSGNTTVTIPFTFSE